MISVASAATMHCCCGSGFAQASRLNFFPGQSLHGIIQGDAVPQTFIPKLIELYLSGEFPIDKIVRYYDPGAINDAFADAARGETPKPVVLFDQQVV